MSKTPITVVWFKRDLRVADHAPLTIAAARSHVLPLYIAEPDVWAHGDLDAMHWEFVATALGDLRAELAALGQPLIVRRGLALEVLASLHESVGFDALYAHEETGNGVTFARDLAVAQWARESDVDYQEWPTNGVVRRLRSRDGWARRWSKRMQSTALDAPEEIRSSCDIDIGAIPTAKELGVDQLHPAVDSRAQSQLATVDDAQATLASFLEGRGERYATSLSAPVSASRACSRLSPYLAWGLLSLRQVVQTVEHSDLAARSRRAFMSRLHWRCHFVQKLESEPEIEVRCFNSAYESLRGEPRIERLMAWQQGCTGFPFVDACIRSLQHTGWINFRMRAMLVSFAAYDLWLDWRVFRDFLGRQFIDYEPGIHYSQLQMQSGTTGINTPRMYNPIKQGYDHDPEGRFVRRWVPELRSLPTIFVHEPWRLSPIERTSINFELGVNYPHPIVDHTSAIREARQKIAEVRKRPDHRAHAAEVFDRHGSRRKISDRTTTRKYRDRRLSGADAERFDAPDKSQNQLNLFD
ncbi:MAG: deoxyribodipyrimidine photo-lyase [Pseudomonadota bacterium]